MPVLSFYEGFSELSFCLIPQTGDYKFLRIPYPYSNDVYNCAFDKSSYYQNLFDIVGQEFGVSVQNCEIRCVGLYDDPKIPYENAKYTNIFATLPKNSIYINHELFALSGFSQSFVTLEENRKYQNFISNSAVYPNIIPHDQHELIVKDNLLRDIINTIKVSYDSNDILVSGERFNDLHKDMPMAYLLILDLIKNSGIFYIRLDDKNILPHVTATGLTDLDYKSLGTLVNSPGKTECLFQTDLGTSQLISLEEEKIFILPLSKGDEARILVKNVSGQSDTKVLGGDLGLVIDTRNKSEALEFKEIFLSVVAQAMEKIT